MLDKAKKMLVGLVSCGIPVRRWRKDFRNYFLPRKHPVYGRIYSPIYENRAEMIVGHPDVFNRNGEKMDMFFLRDRLMAMAPYGFPYPTRFLFDRFNVSLDTHFYTHNQMLERIGRPARCYGILSESESVVPEDYEIFRKHPGLEKEFTLIFTHSAKILEEVDNARFFPFFASPWFGTEMGGGLIDDHAYETKTKNVSIVSSNKRMCAYHEYRIDLARKCRRDGLADAYGTFDGGPMIKIADSLQNYRYSIVIENDISPFFFTNKITDCFISMTVPIYFGATKIGDYFNEDGIIRIKPGDDVRKILSGCAEKEYVARLPAILDNYRRVQQYRNMWDWLYEKYIRDGRASIIESK